METSAKAGGYYRLAFGGEQTSCIGYHATEENVQARREEKEYKAQLKTICLCYGSEWFISNSPCSVCLQFN